MPSFRLPPDSFGLLDLIRRQKVDRLLVFVDRFDDDNRVQRIETDTDHRGNLTSITMEMASGERYVQVLNTKMLHRLDVFQCITGYFNQPSFPDTRDLIDKAFVLLETLFKVNEHRFDCGISGMHLNQRSLLNLNAREAVRFIRHVYDWQLDRDLRDNWISPPESPLAVLGTPKVERKAQEKNQDQEGYEAFIAELDALLSEDDDTTLPPPDQLPKAMPTG